MGGTEEAPPLRQRGAAAPHAASALLSGDHGRAEQRGAAADRADRAGVPRSPLPGDSREHSEGSDGVGGGSCAEGERVDSADGVQ